MVTDEKTMWDYLMKEIGNAYGVAGLMGNLFAESSLNPLCKTGGDKSISGWQYATMVNNGTIDISTFAHDGVAFGLVQWRYWSRKENLHRFAMEREWDIGSMDTQLQFMISEIQTYKTVWVTLHEAKSVKEASDIVMERYEKPGNVSDKMKEKRASFGQGYFDKYAYEYVPSPQKYYVRTTAPNVNIRRGNGKAYSILTQIEKKGTQLEWVATSQNNWHAVISPINKGRFVGWISGEFSEVILK